MATPLANATLSNVTPPPTVDAWGKAVYGAGAATNVRCVVAPISRGQTMATDKRISESDAVLHVLVDDMPGGVLLQPRARITVTVDEDPAGAQAFEIVKSTIYSAAGGLANYECFVKRVSG